LEAADKDYFNLHDAAEFLHQTLWRYRIPHEYHLNHEADHGGSTLVPRTREALGWLGKMMQRALWQEDNWRMRTTPKQAKFVEWYASQ